MRKKTWKTLLSEIIKANNREAMRAAKVISNATMEDRAKILWMCFTQLREMGFKIENPANLTTRHVMALTERWEIKEELSASTLQKRLSILRVFAKWIGKEGMLGPTKNIVTKPENARRTYIAKEDKSWTALGIDPLKIIAEVQAYDQYVGMQLKMMWAFGIRRKEAICFKPRINDRGEFIEVGEGAVIFLKEGTKGGRARVADFDFMQDAAGRRAVLDEAKLMVGSEDAHLGRPNQTLVQNIKHFEYVMQKFGITKDGLGVTSHGLRHQAMNDGYEELAGCPSPVRGGKCEDKTLDDNARIRMTQNAGHIRTQITSAYYGKQKAGDSKQGVVAEPEIEGEETEVS